MTDKAGVKLFKQSSVLGAAGVIRRNLSHIISNDYCSIKMFLMEVFSLSENQDYSLQNILYENILYEGVIEMHFYTSVNNYYMAKARVLAKSVKRFCPDSKFTLVLADKVLDIMPKDDNPFDEIITIKQLGIPVENLNLWIFQHTVVELCTAIKGQALVKFLQEGSDKVVYLDPDIEVFDNLKQLEKWLDEYDILLTPHQTKQEKERREILNNEICSLMHGVYNFGFYAVRNNENGLGFAKWWRDRLIDFCYDDIPNGIFTDQKWGDLVPALFENVYIIKSPAYNVSTWNLSNRTLSYKDNKYYVNGIPLQFYHFSGFDSGAQKTMLDLYVDDDGVAYKLRDEYIKKQDKEGQEIYTQYQSVYNCYDNGQKIENYERYILRSRQDVIDYFKDVNPYICDQEKSYAKWFKHEIGIYSKPSIEDYIEENKILKNKITWLNKKSILGRIFNKFIQ